MCSEVYVGMCSEVYVGTCSGVYVGMCSEDTRSRGLQVMITLHVNTHISCTSQSTFCIAIPQTPSIPQSPQFPHKSLKSLIPQAAALHLTYEEAVAIVNLASHKHSSMNRARFRLRTFTKDFLKIKPEEKGGEEKQGKEKQGKEKQGEEGRIEGGHVADAEKTAQHGTDVKKTAQAGTKDGMTMKKRRTKRKTRSAKKPDTVDGEGGQGEGGQGE